MTIGWLGDATYWLGWIAGFGILTLSVYVAWKAWFGDRAMGRRRCPKCWYDLAYSEGMTCSECGFTAHDERQFGKTRRRIGRGLLAILIAVSLILFVRERSNDQGWANMIPSRVLIETLPFFSDSNNDAVTKLIARFNTNSLSEENLKRLLERCVSGDGGFKPGTQAWANKYGNILNRFRPALAARRQDGTLDVMEELLLDLPPLVILRSRSQWPIGSSAQIGVQVQNWWPHGSDNQVHIAPQLEGAESKTIVYQGLRTPNTSYTILTPPLDESCSSIEIEITTSRRTVEIDDQWQHIDTSTILIPIQVAGRLETMITPISGPSLDEAVKRSISGASRWTGGKRPLRMYVNPGQTAIADFNGIAIGFVAKLYRDDELMDTDHTWWMGGRQVSDLGFGSWSDDPTMKRLMNEDFNQGTWTVHVVSDAALAIRAGEATKYWKGEFTIPLRYREIPQNAPEPHWWQEEEGQVGTDDADSGSNDSTLD
ncbi:MAG: hypothetical protein O7G85_16050 [Planctomycetota bacterium]|nr:hypothetical protein [Planctomycetota bacterium]